MFIATAITNQSKLFRSETKGAIYIALLRSCKGKQTGIYKHFIPTGFTCSRNLLKKPEVRPLLRRAEAAQRISSQDSRKDALALFKFRSSTIIRRVVSSKNRQMQPVHPGEILREDLMKPLSLTVNGLAGGVKLPFTRLRELGKGRPGLNADRALRRSRY